MSAPESPTLVKRKANLARSDTILKSLANANMAPAPAAMPLTAAITGFLRFRMFLTTLQVIRVKRLSSSAFMSISLPMISCTLPPEQKPLPVPVMITTLTESSCAKSWKSRSSSS